MTLFIRFDNMPLADLECGIALLAVEIFNIQQSTFQSIDLWLYWFVRRATEALRFD